MRSTPMLRARLERDLADREGGPERGEGRAAVGERVHADAEPRDAVGAEDAEHRERENRDDAHGVEVLEEARSSRRCRRR